MFVLARTTPYRWPMASFKVNSGRGERDGDPGNRPWSPARFRYTAVLDLVFPSRVLSPLLLQVLT
jgi:hypothetical protein